MGVSEAIILSAIFRPQVSITVAVGDDLHYVSSRKSMCSLCQIASQMPCLRLFRARMAFLVGPHWRISNCIFRN